ncbi:glycosyltransferase family 1 protein [Selenomonas ruminantium]|uniref:glycosyltransferase family 1 protein n=1 Tax=Selenomonas ruminantium TaxID=971 RepID=UPI0026E95189|nr:glycosyltransferase family 1 protein [Selenomonas ruminantium]
MSNIIEEKTPFRVLQVIGIACAGGVESVIMNYYRHIDKNKIQFDFVFDGFNDMWDEEIQQLGGKVYHITSYKENVFKFMKELYYIVKKNQYSIVHSNMNTLSVFSLFPAFVGGAKIRILHNHSTATSTESFRTLLKYILRPTNFIFANYYVACSRLAAEWMYGINRIKNEKVTIVNNAIDLSLYKFNLELRNELRNSLRISEDTVVIGHVGRFVNQKNHKFLIEVFYEINKKNSNSLLLLVGDGHLKPQIQSLVKNMGLDNCVKFLGIRKDVKSLYNAMDYFVLPSWYEGLPVVAVEAQANGLPCLFSNYVTQESKLLSNTLFYDIKNGPVKWAELILSSLRERDPNATEELSKKGFDIKKMSRFLYLWYEAKINAPKK